MTLKSPAGIFVTMSLLPPSPRTGGSLTTSVVIPSTPVDSPLLVFRLLIVS